MWSVELKRVSRVYAAMKSLYICVFCVGVEEQRGIKDLVAPDVNSLTWYVSACACTNGYMWTGKDNVLVPCCIKVFLQHVYGTRIRDSDI